MYLWNQSNDPTTCARCGIAAAPGEPTDCHSPQCPNPIIDASDHQPGCIHHQGPQCRRDAGILHRRLDWPHIQNYLGTEPLTCRHCGETISPGQPVFTAADDDYQAPYCTESCLLIETVKESDWRTGFTDGLEQAAKRLHAVITGQTAHQDPHRHCVICANPLALQDTDVRRSCNPKQ